MKLASSEDQRLFRLCKGNDVPHVAHPRRLHAQITTVNKIGRQEAQQLLFTHQAVHTGSLRIKSFPIACLKFPRQSISLSTGRVATTEKCRFKLTTMREVSLTC